MIAAADYPFKEIIGVEADIALCRVAKQNLRRWGEGRSDGRLKVVHTDARKFRWPKGNLFVFMYSPFSGPVFQQVAERLAAAAGQPGRAVVIAYSADWEAGALERAGCFIRVRMRRRKFWAASTVSFSTMDWPSMGVAEQTKRVPRTSAVSNPCPRKAAKKHRAAPSSSLPTLASRVPVWPIV